MLLKIIAFKNLTFSFRKKGVTFLSYHTIHLPSYFSHPSLALHPFSISYTFQARNQTQEH